MLIIEYSLKNRANKYEEWFGKSAKLSFCYLNIIGTIKKEENTHAMELFFKEQNIDKNMFNPQALFLIFGAVN